MKKNKRTRESQGEDKPKTIVRRTKEDRETTGYTMINPRIVTDASLSKTARLLHTYALTKPDDWSFNATHISKELLGNDDRKAISNALKELRNKGLAIGRFSKPPVMFLEKPYIEMNEEERKQVDCLVEEYFT